MSSSRAMAGTRPTLPAPSLPSRLFLALIRIYQRTLSPALPVITMGRCACRFSPTCSHYAAEAIREHGALRGAALAVWRLLRCTPLTRGGFDPVPPRCVRVTSSATPFPPSLSSS